MPLSPGGVLNPSPAALFCPEQTDFLTFRTPDGFGAVYLDLVEGFQTMSDGNTAVGLTNQVYYVSIESVPELVARFASVKKMRYNPARKEDELLGQGLITRVQASAPAEQSAGKFAAPQAPARPPIFTPAK